MKLVRHETITPAILAASNVTETEAAWSAVTTYALAAVVKRTAADGIPHRYSAAQGSNTNHDPATDDGTWWLDEGGDSRYAMFDGIIQSQTTRADDISVSMDFPATTRIDTLALFNLIGTEATVTVTDTIDGVVYDATVDLISTSGIVDWYAYFWEPIVRLRDLVLDDLPPYSGATIDVSVTESGATVAVGLLVAGLSRDLGGTQYGATLGITDYSVKSTDDFGNVTVVERAFARNADFQVMVPRGAVDEVQTLLADYRATPALYIGSGAYASMAIWGFVADFQVAVAYPDRSLLSLQIKGLS